MNRISAYRILGCALLGCTLQLASAAPYSVTCASPDSSFRSFLERFSVDRTFQNSRMVYPIVVRSGQPTEAALDIQLWGEGVVLDFKTPIFLSPKERVRFGLEQEITIASPRYAEVYVHKPDADSHEETFSFRKHGDCWYLEGLYATSL